MSRTTSNILFALTIAGALSLGASGRLAAQDAGDNRIVNLSGPRFGVTVLSGGITGILKRDGISVGPVITQFGWQSEKRFASSEDGFVGVTELVFLVGGMEQNQFLPSVSWLVGFRTVSGVEFGVGPNVTPISASLALVGGLTNRVGNLNVPINLAVVPSSSGVRISVLSGFNLRR